MYLPRFFTANIIPKHVTCHSAQRGGSITTHVPAQVLQLFFLLLRRALDASVYFRLHYASQEALKATVRARISNKPRDIRDATLLAMGGDAGLLTQIIATNADCSFLVVVTEKEASRFAGWTVSVSCLLMQLCRMPRQSFCLTAFIYFCGLFSLKAVQAATRASAQHTSYTDTTLVACEQQIASGLEITATSKEMRLIYNGLLLQLACTNHR